MKIFKRINSISEALASDEKIKEILGEQHLESLITFAPSLNVTELNELGNAQHFITVSAMNISETGASSDWVVKVGVAANIGSNKKENFMILSDLIDSIIEVLTTKELILGFPEQLVLTETEETLFDNTSNTLWGYTMFFVVKDERH